MQVDIWPKQSILLICGARAQSLPAQGYAYYVAAPACRLERLLDLYMTTLSKFGLNLAGDGRRRSQESYHKLQRALRPA